MTRVFNQHRGDAPAGAVYIGRGSPWGNPFRIGRDGTRDEVCDRFEREVLPRLDIEWLRGKDLVCFCHPLRCHGDSILRKLAETDPRRSPAMPTTRAIFSYPDPSLYRWRLDRPIGGSGPPVAFCLHNPSIAGTDNEDPTSRRGIGFATAWNAAWLTYINPWAGIATDKADLWRMDDPVGHLNNNHIESVAREIASAGGFMIAAWGAVKPPLNRWVEAMARLVEVETIIRDCGCPLKALAVTKDGNPGHILYLPSDARPEPYRSN